MNYTKENIFPMYVGKCKIKTPDGIGDFEAFNTAPNNYRVKVRFTVKQAIFYHDFSDCTLLLKPISKMSEGDKKECRKLMIAVLSKDSPKFNPVFDINEWRYFHTPESFLWLIQHGYAISDQLFELGIAEEIK